MPTPNPTLRREFKGAAAATTLQNSMTNSDTSFVLVAANNWPTGAVGKFVVCINRGQADEEKVLCDTQSSKTVSCLLANRGFDGTTAQAHSAGATVECTISAFDADEWNQHTNATSAVHGVAGAIVGTTDSQTLTNKALNGATLDAASTIGGVSGTTLSGAWTAYTPTLAGFTATITSARYKQVGKTVTVAVYLTITAVTGTMSVTLPVTAATNGSVIGTALGQSSQTNIGVVFLSDVNTVEFLSTITWSNSGPGTWSSGNLVRFTATYEAA